MAQVEPTGSQTHLLVEFAGRQLVTVLDGMVAAAPGDAITLAIRPENVHLFAMDTGRAVTAGESR